MSGGAKNKVGRSTVVFPSRPGIISWASIVGEKEGMGPIGDSFDVAQDKDDLYGEDTWEAAERKLLKDAVSLCASKVGLDSKGVDVLLGGDLLNQIISAAFAARDTGIPFLGLYNACSTMAEALLLGATLVDGGYQNNAMCATVSHFSAAERQYRTPLEHGSPRPPTAQWTVTGSGATFISNKDSDLHITHGTIGKVVDFGVTDMANMGAAMAPSAVDTILTHLGDTDSKVSDFDLIVTGDLGVVGYDLALELLEKAGIDIGSRYMDCGKEIFYYESEGHSGGSGAGCSAVTLNGFILNKLLTKQIKRILFVATGALLSPTSSMQGESIPGISHAVVIERD